MRNISTGAGLCVLGFCVLAAAVVSSSHLTNTAIAAGDGRPAAIAMPHEMLPRQVTYPIGEPTGTRFLAPATGLSTNSGSNASASTACQDLEPNIALTNLHPIDLCFDGVGYRSLTALDYGSADVNGDGVLEHFGLGPGTSIGSDLPHDGAVLARNEVVFNGTITSIRYQAVVLGTPFFEFIQSQTGSSASWYGGAMPSGWRDMDGDGDLDLIVYVSWNLSDSTGSDWNWTLVWIENTGYPASPEPNPYDLDQDGHVNTADLSLLLLEFTN